MEKCQQSIVAEGEVIPERQGMGTTLTVAYVVWPRLYVVHAGDTRVNVTLSDNRELRAEVVGGDKATDLAVLKVDENNLHPARLGDSDQVAVGEWVLAMGSSVARPATTC